MEKWIERIVVWGTVGFIVFSVYALVSSRDAHADDRSMPNGMSGVVTLTDKPCDLDIHHEDEALKLTVATIVLDGELKELKACYFESGPTPVVMQDMVETSLQPKAMEVELFNIIHIIDLNGVIYNMSAEDFK